MPRDLDLTYLSLEVADADPQRIVDDAVAYASTIFPDWVPRNGSTEVVLMEALALGVADLVYAANRLPGSVVEAILGLYDIARSEGTSATGAVEITFDDDRTVTVASGTRFEVPADGTLLEVTADTPVTEASTVVVPVRTAESTAAANGLPVGTALDILDAVPYAVAAEVSATLTGGSDPESDAAYVDRAGTRLARVTSSLVIPVHFTAYCLEDVRVLRATTVDLYDLTDENEPGDDLGHVSVYLYGRGGPLDPSVLTALESQMTERAASMITVHTDNGTVVPQDIDVTVVGLPGYSAPEIQASVTAALQAWMNPNEWGWGRDIIVNEIIAEVGQVAGVDYVDSVADPSDTVPLAYNELATTGTITVTVI